jgi:hypothetical protein
MAGLAVDGLCRAREIVRKTRAQMRGEEGGVLAPGVDSRLRWALGSGGVPAASMM